MLATGWRNEIYDQLVNEAGRATDQVHRISLYREADRLLIENVAIVSLFYRRRNFLLKPWVRSYPVSPRGVILYKDAIIEPHERQA